MGDTIWKYALGNVRYQQIIMPANAKILSVDSQKHDVDSEREQIVLYALVDSDIKEKKNVEIWTLSTGHDFDLQSDSGVSFAFVGTVKLYEGSSMFHVFVDERDMFKTASIKREEVTP